VAVTIDWPTKVISVPRDDMTLVQSGPTEIRELDMNDFRLELKSLEASSEGIPFDDTHTYNSPTTVGGVSLAGVIIIINGYTITFEDGQYAVNLVGANSNFADVTNVNQVSVRSANSAGLTNAVSGLTTTESTQLGQIDVVIKLFTNRMETNPSTGVLTIYDDDDTTVLYSGNIYEDILATQLYRGQGLERRNKLT